MTNLSFKVPGQEPVDPRYASFRDGWAKYIIGRPQYPGLRWSAWSSVGPWSTFALNMFDYIDFGVVGPKSPLQAHWRFGDRPGYVFEWDPFFIPNWKLPELWEALNATYKRVKANRARAVWNPYDGSWREVRPIAEPYPEPGLGHGSGGDSPDTPAPPTELERRLDELIRLYREGKITDEILKQRSLELTREYG